MQLKWLAIPIISATAVLSYAPAADATSLVAGEEPVTQLVQPSPSISPMTYVQINNLTVSEPVTSTPLLCGTTSAPSTFATQAVSPIYYSPNSLQPFVFGASALTPTLPAAAPGASMMYGSTMHVIGDPALVCYGLDANGVHGPTPGVLRDEFEGVNYSPTQKIPFNSSVVLTVFHVPTGPTDYYGYTIDVTIPQLPSNYASMCLPPVGTGTAQSGIDCNFALIEGFDTSVFDASAGLATSGQWCLAPAGVQSCASPPPSGGTSPAFGDININYTNYGSTGISLGASIAPAAAKQFHFVAFRKFASGVSNLPASGGPVVIAALFSPFDLDENFIGDNVAVGYANTPPAVVQSGDAWTVFTGKLGALAENTDSGALSFNIVDQDTAETGGQTLSAAVTLNLAGLSVPVTPACVVISGPGAANRQCSMDINFADPNWWNASVDAIYDGQGNLFATDPGGVGASASIVVTDPLGKSSSPLSVPIHVQSKVNSAPLVAFGSAMPSTPDSKQGGTSYPTYSCSVTAKNCGGTFNVVDVAGVISAQPGPAAAFDELASQTTDVNSVVCGQSGEQDAIFLNAPVATLASTNTFDLVFQLKSPLVTGSSLCTVAITDKMAAFPAGETAQVTSKQFRIVVNP